MLRHHRRQLAFGNFLEEKRNGRIRCLRILQLLKLSARPIVHVYNMYIHVHMYVYVYDLNCICMYNCV